jgi:predicted TIM-barrel fold metal-dependent hydrolase
MSGKIIDIHSHIGRSTWTGTRSEQVDASTLIRNMDILGIEKTCVLPLSDSPEGWYLKSSTEEIIIACSEYPTRLIPFCLIDPRFGDNSSKTDFKDILEEYKERGCVGLGEVIVKMEVDDPKFINLCRQAGKVGFPVLFDMDVISGYGVLDEPGLPRLEKALQLCQGTIFIGHGPTFWAEISPDENFHGYPKGPVKTGGAVPRLMKKYDNLWADLSAGSGYNALTRDIDFGLGFLEQFSHKLLFGTDVCTPYGEAPIVHFLKKIREEKKLSEEKYNNIVEANAVSLLGL